MTIDGGGTFGSILASGTTGIIINDAVAGSATAVVTLRNLSINGAGSGTFGIRVIKAKTVHVENVEIFGFITDGIDVNVPGATGGTDVYLDDVDIRNISGALSNGYDVVASSGIVSTYFDHVRIQRVTTGVRNSNNAFLFIRNSEMLDCNVGIEMQNGASGSPKATIENTFLSNNVTGLAAGTGSTTFLSQSTFTQNGTAISAGGGTVQSSGNNRILGNSSDGLTPTIINPK